MTEECHHSAPLRWWFNDCRCGRGTYDAAWYSFGGVACSVQGLNIWGSGWYVSLVWLFLVFSVPTVWTLVRFMRLCQNNRSFRNIRMVMEFQAVLLLSAIGCCVLRLVHLGLENLAVRSAKLLPAETREERWRYHGQPAFVTYSMFFPCSASLILCLTHYWQWHQREFGRQVRTFEDSAPDHPPETQPAGWRSPVRLGTALVLLEILHDVVAAFYPSQALDTLFILWGVCVLLAVSWYCLVSARKLHEDLVQITQFAGTAALFGPRLLKGPLALVVLAGTIGVLVLSEIFLNEWYAWPHLCVWTIARTVEAGLISVVLWTVGYVKGHNETERANSTNETSFAQFNSITHGSHIAAYGGSNIGALESPLSTPVMTQPLGLRILEIH